MKKSKVLVPAMALLLFSTAASITGTVAWFSSTRVFETSTGDFEVAKLDGNLECTPSGLIGTDVSDKVINMKPDVAGKQVVLGDASFDHLETKLWTDTDRTNVFELRDTMKAAAQPKDGFVATDATKWKYSTVDTKEYFFAVAWNLQFRYNFVAETKGMNIFFDINASSMTEDTGDAHASGNNTAKGFRIAFLSKDSRRVWAGLCNDKSRIYNTEQSSWEDSSYAPTYVDATSSAPSGEYSSDFIGSGASLDRATDATTNQNERLDYLGNIGLTPGAANTLTVTCVAWYEGTDPNVINESRMAKVRASMTFYACQAA